MAVDDVVEEFVERHHRPPVVAELEHVVGQHTQPEAAGTQFVH